MRALFAVLILAVAAATWFALRPMQRDLAAIDRVEEASEAFANVLLDLSVDVQRGGARRLAGYFSDDVEGTEFPTETAARPDPAPGVQELAWTVPEAGSPGAARLAASLQALGDRFSTLEDVRFKLKSSQEEAGGALVGQVKFFLLGRDAQGRREWIRGVADVLARPEGPHGWTMERFALKEMTSLVARREMFQEVTSAAGLTAPRVPPERHDPAPAPGLFRSGGDLDSYGQGAAAGDVDGDGLVDLVVVNPGEVLLYRNLGDGRFAETGALRQVGGAAGPLFLDADNDGDSDLFLARRGTQILLENAGDGTFTDRSHERGVAVEAIGMSASAGDVNGDGRPDVYVACYNETDGQVEPDVLTGARNGQPNLLFVSTPDGRFEEAAARYGVDDSRWSFAAVFGDVDGDGRLDLLVANDYGGGTGVYLRRGDRFVDHGLPTGFGMGVSLGDYDRDGVLDLHVTEMSSTAGTRLLGRLQGVDWLKRMAAGNSLFRGLPGGKFQDVTAETGPFPGQWAWGGGFVDFDGDGWEDVITPNGYRSGARMKDT